MERTRQGTVRRMLHHPARKEAKHYPSYDCAVIPCEKWLPVPPRGEELFLQLLLLSDLQTPATRPSRRKRDNRQRRRHGSWQDRQKLRV